MRYLSRFESYYQDSRSYIGLKKGDIVYMMEDSILHKNTPYLIFKVVNYLTGFDLVEKESVKSDSDFIQVSDMKGSIVIDKDGGDMVFYAHRFLPEFEYNLRKYNL